MKINLLNFKRSYLQNQNKTKSASNYEIKNNESDYFRYYDMLSNISKSNISFKSRFSVSKEDLEEYIKANPDETQPQIAKHFGVTKLTIHNLIKRYNINYQSKVVAFKLSKEELENYIKENPDKNITQIGEHYGVSKATISKLMRENEINFSDYKKQNSEIMVKELEKLIKENPKLSQKEIADYFGVSKETIRRLVIENNIEYKTCKPKITVTKEELESYIKAHPEKTKKEIGEYFNTSCDSIRLLINEFGIEYQIKHRRKSKI